MILRLSLILSLLVGIGNSFAKDQASATALPSYHPFISDQAREQYLALNDTLSKKWPIKGETEMVKTSFGETFIRISGPVDAAPLVLLPGGGANSLMWRTNIEAFSEHYRVYAVNNIYDYGRSVYIRPVKNADDFSNWLNELFSELNLGDSINLLGTSYGGLITSQFALRYPDRLKKIALLAPAAKSNL
jgi:pimeloyl-ACP methyl ester carboxylesterase